MFGVKNLFSNGFQKINYPTLSYFTLPFLLCLPKLKIQHRIKLFVLTLVCVWYTYTCVHIHVHTCTRKCTHVYTYVYTCVHVRVHIRVHMCTDVHTRVHTYTHTHVGIGWVDFVPEGSIFLLPHLKTMYCINSSNELQFRNFPKF